MLFAFSVPAQNPDVPVVGGLDVLIPPVYEIFWSALIILGLWLVLGKALPKIYAMLDERREQIDAGLDAADRAHEDASLAKREREEVLRLAQEEAKGIRDDAQKDAGRIVAQARHEAQVDAQRITDAAKRQIAAERTAAAVALRQDVGTLATQLAERIVGEQLTDEALSQRVIDRFMNDVEADLNTNTIGVDA
ncbi:F0F1 ATP synthase subunit B [Actinomyces minihominis]|uniref:F0F1 ATP synthase subunit B n=1 Tax=Actinomyces minihominis TaxID=2002838 RepID=UPI000C07037F|nr:F0F1 ATP synthase subunit B [Actinomyces minihominis]